MAERERAAASIDPDLVYFFNGLDPLMQVRLELSVNDFELALLSDAHSEKR